MKLYIAAVHGRIVGTDQSRLSTLAVQRYHLPATTYTTLVDWCWCWWWQNVPTDSDLNYMA